MLKGYIGKEMLGTPGVTNAGRPKQRLGRGAVKELGAMEIYENQKIRFQECLFLFSANVYLKNNNKNYRKPF